MAKKSLEAGDQIPLFTLKDQDGNDFSVKNLIGKKKMVIYFYPKDETKVCTEEACHFRDAYEIFEKFDCEVIGISSDSEKSHKNFAENHRLPFILLSDAKKEVRKAFGVPRDFIGLIPGRYTYVVNEDGKIIHVFNSAFSANLHIQEALKMLQMTYPLEMEE